MTNSINILKYPGSKWTIAEWIVSHFPEGYERLLYLEPFFGSGAVFFTKNRSQIETINDIDDNVVNLFRVVRNSPEKLANAVYFTPWARREYEKSYEQTADDEIEKARRFLVRMWQGIGAKSSTKTGWRKNVLGNNGNIPKFHTTLPSNILEVCERLKCTVGSQSVQIENQNAFELIERYNARDVLIYADPPYLLSTRSGKIYKHEFSNEHHERLLKSLKEHKGYVILSGYDSELYNNTLSGWHKYQKNALTESAKTKTEIIWTNYRAERQCRLDMETAP